MSELVKVTRNDEGQPTLRLVGPGQVKKPVMVYVGGPRPYIWVGTEDGFIGSCNPGALTALVSVGRRSAKRRVGQPR